jgi:phage protein D
MAHASRGNPVPASFAVKLDGRPIVADLALWIVNVTVEDDLDLPSMFTLELISKSDERGNTPFTDDTRLALGAAVEISMGYGDDRESLIVGEITALEPTFSIAGLPSLLVRGYDKRHRLNGRGAREASSRKTDGGASRRDLQRAMHVPISVNKNGVEHSYILQADQTDLNSWSSARGACIRARMNGGTLCSVPSRMTRSLRFLTLSLSATCSISAAHVGRPDDGLRVLGWDRRRKRRSPPANADNQAVPMGGKQSAAQHAETIFGKAIETIMRVPVLSQAEADQAAVGRFKAAQLDFIRGDGRLRGRTDVRAGRVLRLVDLGQRFSGDYYVTSAVHRYSRRDGYHTDFRVRRNAS